MTSAEEEELLISTIGEDEKHRSRDKTNVDKAENLTDAEEEKSLVEITDYNKKVRTIFVIGGAQARRFAAHSRLKLPDPRQSDDWKAYDVAEVGENVSNPTCEEARTWV